MIGNVARELSVFRVVAPLMLALVASGCFGSLKSRMQYRALGEADPQSEKRVEESFNSDEPRTAELPRVKVLVNTIPEGLELKDHVLAVQKGYGHVILGKIAVSPDWGFFPGYEESWKKPVCYPQRVLAVVTLGVWMILPISWPCNVPSGMRPSEYWLDQARTAASTAGGDMVVAELVGENIDHEAIGIVGFVIKQDPRTNGTPPVTAPGENKL
jgi:hypothetical protein